MDGAEVRRDAHEAAREAAPWVESAARAGYAAKGVVYVLIGFLATRVALNGGATSGSRDALRSIADEPFGQVLLALVAIGLAGYVLWRIVGAALAPEGESAGRRVFYVVSALAYGGLAWWAGKLAFGEASGGSAGATGGGAASGGGGWTAELMQKPMGELMVAAAGIALIGYGVQQLWRAYTADIGRRLDLAALSSSARTWTIRFGRFGTGARGVVLAIVGGFLITAALQSDPSEARGLGGALDTLRDQPYGPWILGIIALGLIAYGLYNLIRSRYRRIRPV